MYKKVKEYYKYAVTVIYKRQQWDVIKRYCKVSMILIVFVITSLNFRVLFYKETQQINWAIK